MENKSFNKTSSSIANTITVISKETSIGVIRGILGGIPGIGTSLNEAVFDIRARVKQKRFETFVENLSNHVQHLDENLIDKSFLESEEFGDILENLIEKSLKTKHKVKIELYAKILAGSINRGSIDDYDSEMSFINIIDTLTINELIVLKHLSPKKTSGKGLFFLFDEETKAERDRRKKRLENHIFEFEAISLDYDKEKLFELVPRDTRIAIEGLISKSLALDDSSSRIDTKPRTFICLTPLGSSLIKYIASKMDARAQ